MVSSLVGAPVNGVGIVGIYPEAVLRVVGRRARRGPPARDERHRRRNRRGRAAWPRRDQPQPRRSRPRLADRAGGQRGGPLAARSSSPPPGTRAATAARPAIPPRSRTCSRSARPAAAEASPASRAASRSSTSPHPATTCSSRRAQQNGWRRGVSGTSFSSPLVAGAAAWVWTVRPELDTTQLFEVMRRSARDIDAPGHDPRSGFGALDVGRALAWAAPIRDPLEPNDDVEFVRPDGFFATGLAPLTTRTTRALLLAARLDTIEDPRDLYRVWLPARPRRPRHDPLGRRRRPRPSGAVRP